MTPDSRRVELAARLSADSERLENLTVLRDTLGPRFWIAAGFVRNLIWDADFGDGVRRPLDDVDILYFDPAAVDPSAETEFADRLLATAPHTPWQVRNQARMHRRHGDAPYRNLEDAMAHWLETATGIAVRLEPDDTIAVTSAYGLNDLFNGVLRATPSGRARPEELAHRMAAKGWRDRWPGIRLELGG